MAAFVCEAKYLHYCRVTHHVIAVLGL